MLLRQAYMLFLTVFCVVLMGFEVAAQDKLPPLPAPIENMVKEGAQVRYLGKEYGMDGWIAIHRGQEQYFYVTENGEAFVMGLLFDKSGKMLTLKQVQLLQEAAGETLDVFASPPKTEQSPFEAIASGQVEDAFKTPSEQLFSDVEGSNWIPLGNSNAPAIYSFVDPQCPYCHAFIKDLYTDYINNGLVQVRMVPVGFKPETRAQSAFLLSVPDPQDRWMRHMNGDDKALPVTSDVSQQGVQRNLAIMQSWKLNVTPLTVYRSKGGDVKIVQGRAKDIQALVSDLR